MSKRNKPRGKKINPTYWVFCEGKTEESYIAFLRTKYRLPIEIISKVAGSSINSNYIKKTKQGKPTDSKDRDFLMYDGDVTSIIDQLKKLDEATMIISNPSIELWFLFHYKNQKASITVEECIRELCNRNRTQYKKGVLDKKLMEKLDGEYKKACERSKESRLFNNPSSNVYEMIEALEEVKPGK
jgi:hypothetical protein